MYGDFRKEIGEGPDPTTLIDCRDIAPGSPRAVRLDVSTCASQSAAFLVEPWVAAAALERGSSPQSDLLDEELEPVSDLEDEEQRHRAAIALSALGSEQRVDIFRHMASISPVVQSPAQIARAVGLPARVVSSELARLRRARLVREIGTGRRRTYYADNAQARDCLELIHELARVLRAA